MSINYNNFIKYLKFICLLPFYYFFPEIKKKYVVIMVNKCRVYWILTRKKNVHCASNTISTFKNNTSD